MKKNNWITCGIIVLVLFCVGSIFLFGGLGVLSVIFGDETTEEGTTDSVPVEEAPVVSEPTESKLATNYPENLYESVVQIIALVDMDGQIVEGWTGSGSIISSDGLILTNAHVVLSDKFYDVKGLVVALTTNPDYPAEPRYRAEIMQVNDALDLAVIRITTDLDGNPVDYATLNLPAIPLGDSDALELGGDLTILGYPDIGGATITLTSGKVGGFTAEGGIGQRAFIKTSATISGGNSGGLAVNQNQELIGVPTQLGYGGDDQYIDCRVLADTNRDGIVDDSDGCIPTGGFINALRPIKLALPLIEAAMRGEINFVSEAQPVAEAVPVQVGGTLLLQDDFSNPSSGWSAQNTETGFSDYQDGQYIIQVSQPNYAIWGNYENETYTDTIINVDVQVLQSANGTGGFGVMCRYTDNENYYLFEVDEDGYYIIYKYLNDEYVALYNWDNLDALKNRNAMTITVSCIGNELTLAVDGQIIASVIDTSFSQGYIGLTSDTFDDVGIRVGFDNLTVYAP